MGAESQTVTDGTSTATTVLPIPPVDMEMMPNPEIKINAVQAFPDHPSYLIYLNKNPITNTVMDIVSNTQLFDFMNLF
jgi:hypothetical protein